MSRADLTVVPDVERELDELYGRPLEEFTAARNDLAKRLKKAGQTAEAERVGALRKPAVPVWAINQLARRDADGVKKLLAAGEQLLDAQKQALAGRGTERFEDAGKRQRDAIRALVPAAARLLEQAGHRPSAATEERVASSLRAASVDPEARSLLGSGRLEEEVESSGLDLLAGMVPAGRRADAARRAGPSRETALREARDAVKSARETARERQREAAEAEREAKRAAAAADEAAERASELAEAADRAAEAVGEAEAELERLRGSK